MKNRTQSAAVQRPVIRNHNLAAWLVSAHHDMALLLVHKTKAVALHGAYALASRDNRQAAHTFTVLTSESSDAMLLDRSRSLT